MTHGILSIRTSQHYSSRGPILLDCLSAIVLEDVLLIRSIIFCAWMPGRKMDGMISAFLSDSLISIEHFPKLEMPGSIKEHL